MKMCHLQMAQRAVAQRQHLLALRDRGELTLILRTPGTLGLHQQLGQEFVDAARPVVRAELDRQIAECEADLASYGVELA